MEKSIFQINKMDCPSEEQLIRLKLEGILSIDQLEFDIPQRQLTVFHQGQLQTIEESVHSLNLESTLLSTSTTDEEPVQKDQNQRRLLWTVLLINFAFFLIEITAGLWADSMGLVADSLDMLADSFVYGLSLMVVGAAVSRKKRIASMAGYFQITLAIIGFVEIIRRFLSFDFPDFSTMIIVSSLALMANALCLYLLNRSQGKEEAHMQASMIFTSNDVIINLGVIIAGLLVYATDSSLPDLIIGAIVFVVVLRGALRILKLGH